MCCNLNEHWQDGKKNERRRNDNEIIRTNSSGSWWSRTLSSSSESLSSSSSSSSLLSQQKKKKNSKWLSVLGLTSRVVVVVIGLISTVAAILYASNRGIRRSVRFWSAVGPLVVRYGVLKYKSMYLRGISMNSTEMDTVLRDFHRRNAAACVQTVMDLGGIYVKIGQLLSTVGAGLLDDAYVTALRPLQDGIPPRPFTEIASIIERSLLAGRPLESAFAFVQEHPIGAASIAQAHKAELWDGTTVIVKVQYPEVADLFDADFYNLEVATAWINPENLATVRTLRARHERELDFRHEASHLKECSANMRRHGLEPRLVRIPRVITGSHGDGTSNHEAVSFDTTKDVLVMEFLDGTSLADAIDAEREDIARALGMSSANELRQRIMDNLKSHFLDGGGGGSDNDKRRSRGRRLEANFMSGGSLAAARRSRAVFAVAAPVIRAYASFRRKVTNAAKRIRNAGVRTVSILSRRRRRRQPAPELHPLQQREEESASSSIHLGRVIQTLVMVHGTQVIMDGTYNADPHGGNVIIMKDGRLGLIDYGMVGRLTLDDRYWIASSIIALANGDQDKVVRNYRETGYRAGWTGSGADHGDHAYHRFATFHMDRINLTPVPVARNGGGGSGGSSDDDDNNNNSGGDTVEMMDAMLLLKKTIEWSVPDWIEQVRRIGGLLIGVASQAGRPISLAREWKPLAKKFLREHGDLVCPKDRQQKRQWRCFDIYSKCK